MGARSRSRPHQVATVLSEGNYVPAPRAVRRYIVVSAVATPANLVAILGCLTLTRWSPVVCNLVAASLVTAPTYAACRWWVWEVAQRQRGRVVAFWLSSLVNVGASSTVIWMAARHGAPDALMSALPFVTYSSTWALRFLVLDRFVFRRGSAADHDAASTSAPTTA